MFEAALALYESFLYFYHKDHSNAAIHIAGVRFSPITFRLAEALKQRDIYLALVQEGWSESELQKVWHHAGTYAEDKGR